MTTKTRAHRSKTQNSDDHGTARDTGANGVSMAPPAYGVSSIDSQPVQAKGRDDLDGFGFGNVPVNSYPIDLAATTDPTVRIANVNGLNTIREAFEDIEGKTLIFPPLPMPGGSTPEAQR